MRANDLLNRKMKVCGVHNTTLKINQACLDVVSSLSEPIHLFTRNVECYKVRYLPFLAIMTRLQCNFFCSKM